MTTNRRRLDLRRIGTRVTIAVASTILAFIPATTAAAAPADREWSVTCSCIQDNRDW